MTLHADKGFLALDEAEVADFARAVGETIGIEPASLPAVVEHLRGLHRHARIVAAAVGDGEEPPGAADHPAEAFEP